MIGKTSFRIVSGALLALMLLATPSTGHYEPTYLSYRTDACRANEVSDPINIVLFSANGSVVNQYREVDWHVREHTGWDGAQGSRQWVRTHGVCAQQEHQLSLGFNDKHHMRYFPGGPNGDAHRTDAGNRVWMGDAHRERLTNDGPCGERRFLPDGSHVVYRRINGRSGFDQGTAEVVAAMTSNSHSRTRITRGPQRRTFRQCNGDVVGWDGRVHHIAVNPH